MYIWDNQTSTLTITNVENHRFNLFDTCDEIQNFCKEQGIDIKEFNFPVIITEGYENCNGLFRNCSSFNQSVTIPRGVKSVRSMFLNCVSFNQKVEISNGVIHCDNMFKNCKSYNQETNIPDSVEYCEYMFAGCEKFNSYVDISKSLIRAEGMFENCKIFNQEVVFHDKVTHLLGAFLNCESFNQKVMISKSANSIGKMFEGCTSLNSKIEFTKIKCCVTLDMLKGCDNLDPSKVVIHTTKLTAAGKKKLIKELWATESDKEGVTFIPDIVRGQVRIFKIRYLTKEFYIEILSDEIQKMEPTMLLSRLKEICNLPDLKSLDIDEDPFDSMNSLGIYFDGDLFSIGIVNQWSGATVVYDSGASKKLVNVGGNVYPEYMTSTDKEVLYQVIEDFVATGKKSERVNWKRG